MKDINCVRDVGQHCSGRSRWTDEDVGVHLIAVMTFWVVVITPAMHDVSLGCLFQLSGD